MAYCDFLIRRADDAPRQCSCRGGNSEERALTTERTQELCESDGRDSLARVSVKRHESHGSDRQCVAVANADSGTEGGVREIAVFPQRRLSWGESGHLPQPDSESFVRTMERQMSGQKHGNVLFGSESRPRPENDIKRRDIAHDGCQQG